MTSISFAPIAFQCGPIFGIEGESYTDPDGEIYYGYLLDAQGYGWYAAIDARTGNTHQDVKRFVPIDKFLPPPAMVFAYARDVVVIR